MKPEFKAAVNTNVKPTVKNKGSILKILASKFAFEELRAPQAIFLFTIALVTILLFILLLFGRVVQWSFYAAVTFDLYTAHGFYRLSINKSNKRKKSKK